MAEPGVDDFNSFGDKWADELSAAVSNWIRFSDRSSGSWKKMMRRVLEGPLVLFLRDNYGTRLTERGIETVGESRIRVIVQDALNNTDDIRQTLLNARQDEDVIVAAPMFISKLIDRVHQLSIVKSITRVVSDAFELASVAQSPGFTGRRKWQINVASSRHATLHGVIKGPDELFNVGNELWFGPRENIQNAAQASGCRCSLSWERTDGRWV